MSFKKTIKVIFVINELKKRGAEQQLLDVITRFPSHISVNVFKFSGSEADFPEFSTCRRFILHSNRHNGKYNILKFKSLLNCLCKSRYDAIITVGTGTALFLGRLCAVLCGIPVIYSELHTFDNLNKPGNEYFETLNRILNALIGRFSGRRAYKFLPVSAKVAEKVILTAKGYPIMTLYNGIAVEDIDKIPNYRPTDNLKSILFQIFGRPTVVQVGSLDQNKNQIFTLKCIKTLLDVIPDICCLIIGEGNMRRELNNCVISNGLADHVLFTGQIDRMDALYLMSKSSVFVLTSDSEAFPMVLIEAQGLSIPVVSFDVGGTSEIIQDNVTGYLVKKNDEEIFLRKLFKLLTDNTLAKNMGVLGRHRVLENFTADKRVKKLVSMIEGDLKMLNSL
jgi:glycosyltransferase involved in cell wall biosynthesis